MKANVAKVKSQVKEGHDPKRCSYCTGVGELDKAGAKQQVIETHTGAAPAIRPAKHIRPWPETPSPEEWLGTL